MHQDDHFDNDFLIRLLRDPGELQNSGRETHFGACQDCQDKLELYRRFQTFLQHESDFEVPANWVTRAMSVFEAEERGESSTTTSKLFGWLMFDSLLADGVGVRMPVRAATERHLVWESARFRIDLLIESADPDQVVIIGQLVKRRSDDNSPLAGAVVEVRVAEDVFRSEVLSTGEFIVPVGRLTRGHPMEIQFQFTGVFSLVLLILS
jgi:hypothetical protein